MLHTPEPKDGPTQTHNGPYLMAEPFTKTAPRRVVLGFCLMDFGFRTELPSPNRTYFDVPDFASSA
jgi:hypothetical protein